MKEAAPFVRLCWKMGWNEANGGNFSWRQPTGEIEDILTCHYPEIAGKFGPLMVANPDLLSDSRRGAVGNHA